MASVLVLCPGFTLVTPFSWLKLSNAAFHQCGSDRLFSVFSVGKRQNQGEKQCLSGLNLLYAWLNHYLGCFNSAGRIAKLIFVMALRHSDAILNIDRTVRFWIPPLIMNNATIHR